MLNTLSFKGQADEGHSFNAAKTNQWKTSKKCI